MATQQELKQFRDIIGKRPEAERQKFIAQFQSLGPEKKSMAIQKVLENAEKLTPAQTQADTPSDPFLPGQKRTEEKIAGRTSALESLREEVMTPYSGNVLQRLLKAGVTGMKTVAVPLERAEAAASAPLLELQKSPATRRSLLEVAWEGLKGERLAQFGDVPRQAGVPEFLSSFIGLAITFKATDALSKGKLVRSARTAEKFIKSKFPRIMGKNFVLNRAKMATQALDDMHSALSKQYDDLFAKIGNKPVNAEKTGEALMDLPANILRKLAKSKLVRKGADEKIVYDVDNLKQIRGIIRKAVPEKIWNGRAIGDPQSAQLQQIYGKLSSIMAEGNDELVNLNRSYAQFLDTRQSVGRVLWDTDGNVVANPLQNLLSKTGDRGKQVVFEKFAKQFPEGQQIIKDIQKYNSRQTAKSLLKKVGATVAIGGIGGAVGGTYAHRFLGR